MASKDGSRISAPQLERQQALGPVKPKQTHLLWLQQQCGSDEGLFKPYVGEGKTWEEKQTFLQWKSQTEFQRVLHPIRMRQKTIVLQPLVHSAPLPGYSVSVVEQPVMEHLQRFCQAFFLGMEVALAEPLDMVTLKNLTSRVHALTNRTQFLVPDLLRHLKARRPRSAYCVVGITLFDLYPSPEWNFVMGHALLTEGCAVFSFGRHFNSERTVCEGESTLSAQLKHLWVLMRDNRFALSPIDHTQTCDKGHHQLPGTCVESLLLHKVMSHEICHVLGMKHCYYFHCAMNESASIDEAISQPLFLCPICLRKLHKALKFNIPERYRLLRECCQELFQVAYSLTDNGRHDPVDPPPTPCANVPTPVKEHPALPTTSSPGSTYFPPTTSSPSSTYFPPTTSSPGSTYSLAGQSATLPYNQFQQSLDWLEKCLQSLNSSII